MKVVVSFQLVEEEVGWRLCSKISIPRWHLAIPGQTLGFGGSCLSDFIFAAVCLGDFGSILVISLVPLYCQQKDSHAVLGPVDRKTLAGNIWQKRGCARVLQPNQHLVVCQVLTVEPHRGLGGTQRRPRNNI